MDGGSKLVLLERCGDVAEASALRAFLQANGIHCVVQGEQHRSMLGILGAYIEPRVLVAEFDLERARELIDSINRSAAEDLGAPALDGAVCAIHEALSAVACERCGTFLCVHCAGDGPALCDLCEEKEQPSEERRKRRRRAGAATLALLFGPPVLFGLFETLSGLFW